MICPNCGFELDDNEQACSLCGYEFVDTEVTEEFFDEADENIVDEAVSDDSENEAVPSVQPVKEKSGKKNSIIIVLMIVIIAVLCAVIVFLLKDKDKNKSTDNNVYSSSTAYSDTENTDDATTTTTVSDEQNKTDETTTTTTTEATTTTTVEVTTSATVEATTTTKVEEVINIDETELAYACGEQVPVYESMSTDSAIIGYLSDGEEIRVIRYYDGENDLLWCEILYNGTKAYVSQYNVISPCIYLDPNDLLIVDTYRLFGYSYDEVCEILNVSLPEPQEFPWWGVDLKNVDFTYNNIPLCFMFQYDKLVMIIYDVESEFRNDTCDAAYDFFGESEYFHYWHLYDCSFELFVDTYATDGTTHFKQQYTSYDMIEY